MPTWGDMLREIGRLLQSGELPQGVSPFDFLRRKFLRELHELTGRNTILYASKWKQGVSGQAQALTMIGPEDVHGFMEVIHGLRGPSLDLIIDSPGGFPEAAESLVIYLRSKFTDIRVIIPHAAMSAATMLACAANRLVMGRHSFLGPIDPQMSITVREVRQVVPAHAILEQFELAKQECEDPRKLAIWLPILQQYGPALIMQCKLAHELSVNLVAQWLERYMFLGWTDARERAKRISFELSSHENFKSHSRFIPREWAEEKGLIVEALEGHQDFQDLVLSVFHAVNHTFDSTTAIKIIENHQGKAFIKLQSAAPSQILIAPPGLPTPVFPPAKPPQSPPIGSAPA